MDLFNKILLDTNNVLTGYVLLIALLGGGIWFTIQTGFVQFREFGNGWRRVFGGLFKKKKNTSKEGGISSFQALTTAIAAQVGTGNLAGAATAIAAGGPGAIFWMWVSALLGMATIFCEATLAQVYRTKGADGKMTGGPVYYIRAAFKGTFGKVLAATFAILITLALGLFGNAVQANSITDAFHTAFFSNVGSFTLMGQQISYDKIAVGIILAIVAWLIFGGGISRIATITEKLVPIMACFYLLGGLIIVIMNIENVPYMFSAIIRGAFTPQAVCGGAFGVAMKEAVKKGVARGLFSNEAGSGSAPCAAAAAEENDPVKVGLVQALGVFIDTIVICSCTAMIMLLVPENLTTGLAGMDLLQKVMSYYMGNFGVVFIAITLALFSFSTFLGILFYARSNVAYLFGDRWCYQTIYKIFALIMLFVGGLQAYTVVWDLGDVGVGLMTVFNLMVLFPLSGEALRALKTYEEKKKMNQ